MGLFLLVEVTGIIRSIAKLGNIGIRWFWPTLKPTYIYWWAHEFGSSRHIVFKSARTSVGFWKTMKSCRVWCMGLFLVVKVTGIIRLVGKVEDIETLSLWLALKPTYIYWWAHEVEGSGHIEPTSAKSFEGFGETTKSCRVQCKGLFLLVKVMGIIGSIAKLGNIGPQRLWPISKPTYWWVHEFDISRHIRLRSARTSGGLSETTKSCWLQGKWLFRLVKVIEIIRSTWKYWTSIIVTCCKAYLDLLVGSWSWEF